MNRRQAAALLLSTDLRAVLADVEAALDALYETPHLGGLAIEPLHRAYKALAGRAYIPRAGR